MPDAALKQASKGFVGRVPVRNIWLLMLFASELYKLEDFRAVATEDAVEDLPDILGALLAQVVEVRLRRPLHTSYVERTAIISRVRGRIDMLKTERHQLRQRGLVACRFDDLATNTIRNRYTRAALSVMATRCKESNVRARCRAMASALTERGVVGGRPTRAELGNNRVQHHERQDRLMIAAAQLALDLQVPMEEAGTASLPRPVRDEVWARRLFERAVGGFYEAVLPRARWAVSRGETLDWQISEQSAGIADILPGMRTDVIVSDRQSQRRLVIDTKFNEIVTKGWHREYTLRSGYIYQMYAYLKSQIGPDATQFAKVDGLILHPGIASEVDEFACIQGHRIRFATVDLAATTSAIRKRLLELVGVT